MIMCIAAYYQIKQILLRLKFVQKSTINFI